LEVKQETGLTISVGVSYNKIFAKLGSDMKKPDATTEINESNFKEKVWRLNANEMIMVGEKTYAQLKKMNIITLGDLANSNENLLLSTFGINGIKLKRYASGLDDSPVVANANLPPIKSVGHGTTTKQDITDYLQADKVIYYLSEMVATRLRRYGMEAQVIHIDIRYSNLSHKTIQCRVEHNFIAKTIAETACTLLRSAWKPDIDTPLRTITVSTADLTPVASNFQTSLFDNNNSEKMQKIEFTLDQIRKKFGFNSISRACLAGDDLLADKLATKEDLLPFKK
ncbi:MAG: DNA polymerase IV, partial [Clostridia bacterium]